jgi:hypothetical protein
MDPGTHRECFSWQLICDPTKCGNGRLRSTGGCGHSDCNYTGQCGSGVLCFKIRFSKKTEDGINARKGQAMMRECLEMDSEIRWTWSDEKGDMSTGKVNGNLIGYSS